MAEEKVSKSVALPVTKIFFMFSEQTKSCRNGIKKKFVLPKTNMSKTSVNSVFLVTCSNKRRMWSLSTV